MKLSNRTLAILAYLFLSACHTTPTNKDKSMQHTHHGIDYIEFSIVNMEVSKNFYSRAFGWSFTDYAPTYAGIKKPEGGEYGGLSVVDSVKRGGPLIVLYSNNLMESLTAVKSAGGKITKEIFEFPGGQRFEFEDPDGNALAVWSENSE